MIEPVPASSYAIMVSHSALWAMFIFKCHFHFVIFTVHKQAKTVFQFIIIC